MKLFVCHQLYTASFLLFLFSFFIHSFFSDSLFHFQVGNKRFITGVMAAFSLFNNLADFMGRVNNVVGWFDNIDRFMETGGTESESQVNADQITELTTMLEGLAGEIESKTQLRRLKFTLHKQKKSWMSFHFP